METLEIIVLTALLDAANKRWDNDPDADWYDYTVVELTIELNKHLNK